MMTLNEAIIHAKEMSDNQYVCKECQEEHGQLAEWLEELKELKAKREWIPCSERLPEEEEYILLSFKNYTGLEIGRYEKDGESGHFYPGDEEESYASYGLVVNAWMPLPEAYKEEEIICE